MKSAEWRQRRGVEETFVARDHPLPVEPLPQGQRGECNAYGHAGLEMPCATRHRSGGLVGAIHAQELSLCRRGFEMWVG